MPAHARFTPTGTFTCQLELDCGLAGATAERLRKIIGNCALGIEFKGPNVDGTAPLDTDGARIFARGLRALLEAEWTETVSAKRGEAIYDRAKQRPAWPDVALFQNDDGESCSGNARAISQELTRRAPQIKQIWALRDPEQIVPNAHMNIRPGSSAYYKHLARARFIIGDADLPDFVEKRPGALHLQTALPRADDGPQLTAQTLSRWDIVLSPHTFATKRLRQALHFTGEILEHGNPRNDILRDVTARETIANRVRSELGIHARRKIVLYVPERGDVRPPVSFHTLKRALGDDHTFLLRLPRDVTNSLEWLAGYGGFAVDVSHYGALSDLLCAADVFVTDTSPAIVDFALTGRPIVFYLRDTEILDPAFIEQAPGPIVRRQTGLIRALQRIDDISEKFAPQYRAFVETYCSAEQGNAAATAVSRLLERSRL
jgi:CDP-glycerol glycerophosphotransferase